MWPYSTAANGCATQLARGCILCNARIGPSRIANKELNVHVRCRRGRSSEEVARTGSILVVRRAHPLAPSLFLRRPLTPRYVDDKLSRAAQRFDKLSRRCRTKSFARDDVALTYSHNDALFRYPTRPGSSPDPRTRLDQHMGNSTREISERKRSRSGGPDDEAD